MAIICHGSGDAGRGCCYVAGQVCPLRWKVENDHVYDATETDLGTVDDFVNGITNNRQARIRIKEQLTGITYACSVAAKLLMNDPSLLNNRPAFNDAWNNDPTYVAQIRPHWVAIENQLGLPEGSYQCSTWRGTGIPQCCFAEDEATNAVKAANLPANAKAVREAGGL